MLLELNKAVNTKGDLPNVILTVPWDYFAIALGKWKFQKGLLYYFFGFADESYGKDEKW